MESLIFFIYKIIPISLATNNGYSYVPNILTFLKISFIYYIPSKSNYNCYRNYNY